MKAVLISFPQIIIDSKIVKVSEEEYKKLIEDSSCSEVAEFIYKNLNELEKNHTYGKNQIEDFIDMETAGVKSVGEPCFENEKEQTSENLGFKKNRFKPDGYTMLGVGDSCTTHWAGNGEMRVLEFDWNYDQPIRVVRLSDSVEFHMCPDDLIAYT